MKNNISFITTVEISFILYLLCIFWKNQPLKEREQWAINRIMGQYYYYWLILTNISMHQRFLVISSRCSNILNITAIMFYVHFLEKLVLEVKVPNSKIIMGHYCYCWLNLDRYRYASTITFFIFRYVKIMYQILLQLKLPLFHFFYACCVSSLETLVLERNAIVIKQ